MSAASAYVFDDLREDGWKSVKPSFSICDMEEEQEFSYIIKVPLRKFSTEENILYSDKPVMIEITLEDGIFYATNETLNIDAEGNSIANTILDFSRHIIYFYSYYTNKNETEVMGNAARLKKVYDDYFHI
ncbi:MAG TPA: hypothetical protein ENI76_00185 [Ignavibacteria bacterium]|nr:hypothetical protein [Ignavibacteria bacterium]